MVTLALDIGGTRMKLALLQDGKIIKESMVPAYRDDAYQKNLDQAETEGRRMMAEMGLDHIDGLGIAFPGLVNPRDKVVVSANGKFVDAVGYDLKSWVKRTFDCPFILDNDSNAALIGELTYGCAQDTKDAVMMIFGTGVGAGVMCAGRLLHGMLHPEAGHMLVRTRPTEEGRCVCPSHASCLEGLASGPAIAARWGKPAAELADNAEVWALEGDYLGQMCANLVLMYSPRRIVLGGGVMHQEQLYGIVRKKTLEYLGGYIQTAELKDMERYICAPGCGGDQGILGAAELARRALA